MTEKTSEIHIRMAAPDDAAQLLEIYGPYVEDTAITFEYDIPSIEEFKHRIQRIQKRYPYLVAEVNGQIIGYAYASVFKDRAAYDWSVETSVYMAKDCRGMGIGKALYKELEEKLKAQGIRNLYACISYPEVADEYLTADSVHFHEHMGYRIVGEFHSCGYKFKRWYNMVWMEKFLS